MFIDVIIRIYVYICTRIALLKTSSPKVLYSKMLKAKTIEQCEAYVKSVMTQNDCSHDFSHILRVCNTAEHLRRDEGHFKLIEQDMIFMAALFHEIGDRKYGGDPKEDKSNAQTFLLELGCERDFVQDLFIVIDHISFSKELEGGSAFSDVPEQLIRIINIVQDADRLDAIGAVGIARCFAYGATHGSPLHNPNQSPRLGMSAEEYKNHQGTCINHFEEKLFTIKDRMKTAAGRVMAESRHQFMVEYKQRFVQEWKGEM